MIKQLLASVFEATSLERKARRRIPWGYALFSVNLVVLTYALFDRWAGLNLHSGAPPLFALARIVTDAAEAGWILFVSAFIAIAGWAALHKRSKCNNGEGCENEQAARMILQGSVYVFTTVAVSGLIANLLKRSIGRARPLLFETEGTLSFRPFAHSAQFESFPSGHATTAGALFVALALLAPRLRAALFIAGIWLSMARVIVGAHYPSDVVGGFAFGGWFSVMTAFVFAGRGFLFRIGTDGIPQPLYHSCDVDPR